jgi:AcrR family transcriptional regulator
MGSRTMAGTRKMKVERVPDKKPPAETPAPAASRRPRGRPRQVPVEEQREQILEAATRLFTTEGYDGTTSERIAEVSGVGRPSVYQLFGSKNEVFIAAVDRAFTRMLDRIRRSLGTTSHVRGRKQAVANIGAYFDIVTEEPDTFRMLLLADVSGDAATREAAKAIRTRLQDAVAAYMRSTWEGFQDLDPRDAELGATMISAAAEAAAVHHLERPDRTTPEIVQFVANFVWAGIYDLAVGHDIPLGRTSAKKK